MRAPTRNILVHMGICYLALVLTPAAMAADDSVLDAEVLEQTNQEAAPLAPPSERRMLTVLGIDAGEWAAIEYMRRLGKMPHLDKLIKGGATGTLESIHPMFTPIVWTTIATGKSPLQHGIRGFKLLNPETGKKIPVNRTMRRTSAIWNMLSVKGLRSLIVGWFATWPAEEVKGTIVSDYTWPLKSQDQSEDLVEDKMGLDFKDQTFPQSLYHRLKTHFIDKYKDNKTFTKRFGLAVKGAPYALKHSYAKDLSYFKMYSRLRAQSRYDLSTFYIQGADLLSHQYWREFSLLMAGKLSPGTDDYREADHIVRYYEFIDDVLGVYVRNIRQKNETLLIVSDHGFEARAAPVLTKVSDDKFAKRQYWHRKEGILIANGPKVKAGTKINGATIFDVAPSILGFFGLPVGNDMQGSPVAAICNCSPKAVAKVKSYDDLMVKQDRVRSSPYDQAILKALNDFGYIQ